MGKTKKGILKQKQVIRNKQQPEEHDCNHHASEWSFTPSMAKTQTFKFKTYALHMNSDSKYDTEKLDITAILGNFNL